MAGFQKRRVEYKAEKQVLASSFPGVAALAFTGGLELGSHGLLVRQRILATGCKAG